MSVTQEMIEAALPGGVPARIQAMIAPTVADGLLEDFKVGPILPFGTQERSVLVAISDEGESAMRESPLSGPMLCAVTGLVLGPMTSWPWPVQACAA